jgi:CDP-diacylglycerol---glycerol-3-phosphate 3-phosphatidyltransferase
MWGKSKTVSQMIMIIVVLSGLGAGNIVGTILIYIAAILTVISGCDYIIKNKDVLKG